MSQNIEIEFKNMLTQSEYEMLLQALNIRKEQITSQENHYFDTARFSLKEKEAALRIRKKSGTFELTLKQPAEIGLLESNQVLSEEETSRALQLGIIPLGLISNLLKEMGIPTAQLQYFGSLKTNRAEVVYKNGLLVLDHSIYLNKEDYEIEYEVNNYEEGEEVFHALLNEYGIPLRKTENKIRRFYLAKYAEGK